jgi:hypothetical protein
MRKVMLVAGLLFALTILATGCDKAGSAGSTSTVPSPTGKEPKIIGKPGAPSQGPSSPGKPGSAE